MGLFAEVENGSACLDMVVADIFRTMMRCGCLPSDISGDWEDVIRARVRFLDEQEYECDVRLRAADADALVVLLTGRADSTIRGDVAGELCNMIAGGWMNRVGFACGKVELLPPVIDTMGNEESVARETCILSAAYSFDGGEFLLQMRSVNTLQVS